MNGMFARLSARVGGLDGAPVGALRPRPPSLYGPGPSARNADRSELEEDEFDVAAAPLPPARQRPSPLAGDAPPTLPPTGAEAAAPLAKGRPSTPVETARDEDTPPVPRRDGGGRRAHARLGGGPEPSAGADSPDDPAPGPRRQVPAAVGGTAERARPWAGGRHEAGDSSSVPRPVTSPSGPPSEPSTIAVFDLVATEVAGPALPAAPAVRTALPAPPRSRRVPEPSRRHTGAAPQTEPPAVLVTIGRVEIRAVPEPAAAAARRDHREPAVTTLDAYLRQRAHRS